jgi:hypothetical protein
VAAGIAAGEFDTMSVALAAALVDDDDDDFIVKAAVAGGSMLSVLAALKRLDGAAIVLQEVSHCNTQF